MCSYRMLYRVRVFIRVSLFLRDPWTSCEKASFESLSPSCLLSLLYILTIDSRHRRSNIIRTRFYFIARREKEIVLLLHDRSISWEERIRTARLCSIPPPPTRVDASLFMLGGSRSGLRRQPERRKSPALAPPPGHHWLAALTPNSPPLSPTAAEGEKAREEKSKPTQRSLSISILLRWSIEREENVRFVSFAWFNEREREREA